jgi:hypothetical protein
MKLSYGLKTNLLIIVLSVPGAAFRAFVLAMCWRWFAVPIGAPAVGWAHAYGLGVLATLGTLTLPAIKDRDVADAAGSVEREATTSERAVYVAATVSRMWLLPSLMLGFAYVAHLAMGTP